MTIAIIIIFCVLLLIAYLFDLTSSKTLIPSVILLLLTGWLVRRFTEFMDMVLPNFDKALPIFGTIGLILIVLEGALELELKESKKGLIIKSAIGAFLPMAALGFLLAFFFQYFGNYTIKESLTNAIPFCVISSAIAIPSVRDLSQANKDFVIYESSLSEILGVLFFNFVALNEIFDWESVGNFGLQIVIITVVSFLATITLSFMLSKIQNHIKFVPIILLVILIYAVSKVYHLPALVFILMFGLFIGNLDELKGYKWTERLKPEVFNQEVQKFKALVGEAAFLIKALFFLLFGYLIETSELFNPRTLIWAFAIVIFIFAFRAIQIKLSRLPLKPLFFVAPRGLITILLFISIAPAQRIFLVNKSLIIQVIVLTTLFMMVGLMITQKSRNKLKRRELVLGDDDPEQVVE